MKPVPHGEPYAGNLHVRFDEGAGVPDNKGRSALLYTLLGSLDEMLTAPIRRRVIDKMRPWNDSLDKPDRSDMPYDGVIRDLED